MKKLRADQLLVSRGLAESRTRAQALIMAGAVFSGERKLAKAGEMLAEDAPLEVRGKDHPWVSRGGIKLEHGLAHFGFDVGGATAPLTSNPKCASPCSSLIPPRETHGWSFPRTSSGASSANISPAFASFRSPENTTPAMISACARVRLSANPRLTSN